MPSTVTRLGEAFPALLAEATATPCSTVLAERVGFEPTDRLPGQRFSRPPHSTALAPLPLERLRKMAERVGFEPTVEFPLHTLSKRAP